MEETEGKDQILLDNIKKNLTELSECLTKITDHWIYEDGIYRYYHQSFKVFSLQGATLAIVKLLEKIAPEGTKLNEDFINIFNEGTGKTFKMEDNRHWDKVTRPIMEAFFHAKFLLEMAIKYGIQYEVAPQLISSGWGAVLYLYNIR